MSDVTFSMKDNNMRVHHERAEPWQVTLVDTGEKTMTGGRLKRIEQYVASDDVFCFTYGDGLADIDITKLIKFHLDQTTLSTLTAVYPPGRFGDINTKDHKVTTFEEKPRGDRGMINGGFFVLSPKVMELLKGDETIWEAEPLETLAQQGQLSFFEHEGFWQPMDTMRDKLLLEELWYSGKAPWKVW